MRVAVSSLLALATMGACALDAPTRRGSAQTPRPPKVAATSTPGAAPSGISSTAQSTLALPRFQPIASSLVSGMVKLDAGYIVAAGAGNVLSHNGGQIVVAGAGNLVGMDGGTLIGADGASLVGPDGASLVGPDGADQTVLLSLQVRLPSG